MFTKSLIAAAAITAAVTTAAPVQQAEARTNIDINIGIGGFGPGYGPGPVYAPHWGVSCGTARHIVKRHGFYNVRAFDCGRPVYQYIGWKFGQPYKVKVNLAGHIINVRHL